MISIGSVLRGPELRESNISDALRIAAKTLIRVRGDLELGSVPSVNVVFYVPGSQGQPDWDGLRDGRYSAKDKLLMVQVAVPEEMVSSNSALEFIVDSLHGANAVAFEVFRQKGMDYPLRKAEELVASIRDIAMGMV